MALLGDESECMCRFLLKQRWKYVVVKHPLQVTLIESDLSLTLPIVPVHLMLVIVGFPAWLLPRLPTKLVSFAATAVWITISFHLCSNRKLHPTLTSILCGLKSNSSTTIFESTVDCNYLHESRVCGIVTYDYSTCCSIFDTCHNILNTCCSVLDMCYIVY